MTDASPVTSGDPCLLGKRQKRIVIKSLAGFSLVLGRMRLWQGSGHKL